MVRVHFRIAGSSGHIGGVLMMGLQIFNKKKLSAKRRLALQKLSVSGAFACLITETNGV
jgi:hypothetical protein